MALSYLVMTYSTRTKCTFTARYPSRQASLGYLLRAMHAMEARNRSLQQSVRAQQLPSRFGSFCGGWVNFLPQRLALSEVEMTRRAQRFKAYFLRELGALVVRVRSLLC